MAVGNGVADWVGSRAVGTGKDTVDSWGCIVGEEDNLGFSGMGFPFRTSYTGRYTRTADIAEVGDNSLRRWTWDRARC